MFFIQFFRIEVCIYLLSPPYVLRNQYIWFSFIWKVQIVKFLVQFIPPSYHVLLLDRNILLFYTTPKYVYLLEFRTEIRSYTEQM